MAPPSRPGGLVERGFTAVVWSATLVVVGLFIWIVGDLVRHGAGQLSWSFLVAAPERSGRAGGIGPILVSTALILAVCLAAAVPIGVAAAVALSELARRGGLFGRGVRRSLDLLAGVPSIVFGLFGNAFFCVYLGLGFSILAGGLTLACMVLPLLVRVTEEGLRAVPDAYRQGAAALGLSRATSLLRVVLPAAAPALVVGLVLSLGRAVAETAALLFTSGYVDRLPGSLLDSGRSLSVHIYDLAMNVPGGEANAYATALVLVILLLAVNSVAGALSRRFAARREP